MALSEILAANLLSPVVLAFALGVIATVVRSDLRFPPELYTALSIYLLLAIGLKGGVELRRTPFADFAAPAGATLLIALVTPLTSYGVLRGLARFRREDAAAVAAHYGSVSIVTFVAARALVDGIAGGSEGFMSTLVAILEVPGIIVALLLAQGRGGEKSWGVVLHDVLAGRSILLLVGGLVIGFVSGEAGMASVAPFFVTLFNGVLALFLLEMGMVTAQRVGDLRKVGPVLVAFAVLMPIVHGAFGAWLGVASGLSVGGATVLGTMAASASYIAAPTAVRIAIPTANPSLYLTAALGITFPFNLTLGIPLYYQIARWLT